MRTTPVICILGLLIVTVAGLAHGQTVFFDTFRDGDAEDGMPVTWVPNSSTLMGVENRSLVIEDTSLASATPSGVTLFDTSIRSQFRLLEDGEIGLWGRGVGGPTRPFGLIRDNGVASIFGGAEIQTDFDPKNEDLVMQLDLIGEDRLIQMWLWRPGDPMPSEPTLSDFTAPRVSGRVAVFTISADFRDFANPGVLPTKGAFRYVHVAESHIPEPSTAIMAALAAVGFVAFGRRRLCG